MAFTNTQDAATIGTTEYSLPNDSTTLTPQTTDVELQAFIDFFAMTAGDEYLWQLKEKINAGTQRLVAHGTIVGVQTTLVVVPSVRLTDGWDLTVKKIAGTDRSIAWALRYFTL